MTHFTMKFEGLRKEFLYDHEKALVYYVSKTTAEEKAENKEWIEKYGKQLWDTMECDGIEYTIIDGGVGLRNENWNNKEVRKEYLTEWLWDMEEELFYMTM